MSDNPFDDAPLAELSERASLREYTFTSAAPGVGDLVARLRGAWNSVATKWQVRPMMEQQSAFNRALVDWLARPSGAAELDARLIEQDGAQTRLNRQIAVVGARASRAKHANEPGRRLRVAYFSPMPPSRSGIADYSAELLPHLAELADITVFTDDSTAGPARDWPARRTGEFPRLRGEFDLPLYQMGNSDRHEAIYDYLVRYPGVVVLHDYFLHHFIRHHTAGHGDWTGYGRELAYSLGTDGRRLARAIRAGWAAAPLFDVPLNRRVIDLSLGLIVHSEYAAEGARRQRPPFPLAVIPALVETRAGHSLRPRLGLPDDAVLFGSFGQVTAEKQIDPALRAFRRVRDRYPTSHYLLVGEVRPDVDLPALVSELGLGDAVHSIGHVDDLGEFVDWIHTADIVVNLRRPTAGETSAVALRAMAAARPLIVFDHGWYAELPAAAALNVPPGDAAALESAMERLVAAADLRATMGRAGREYVQGNCTPPRVARAYLDFLHAVLEPPWIAHA